MEEKKVKAFFNDQVDMHRKVICVFGESITEGQMKKVISDYLRAHEYDVLDDFAPLRTEEEVEIAAGNIINGLVIDCDMDRYFIDEVVMYV